MIIVMIDIFFSCALSCTSELTEFIEISEPGRKPLGRQPGHAEVF